MEETKEVNQLASASVSRLMVKFGIPSIIGMLVGALYNMIDQLFIGQKIGPLGNAATNIAFPLTTLCMSLALLFGIGGASCFNLSTGMGDKKRAGYYAGNSLTMLTISGILLMAVTLIFLTPMLRLFGSTDNVLPYAQDYVRVTAVGFPFLLISTGGGHLIRADGSPQITMLLNIVGAVINIVLDAVFVLVFNWGMAGAAAATVIGQFVSAVIVIVYAFRFKTIKLEKKHFIPQKCHVSRVSSIGMASCFNQIAIGIVQVVLNNSLKHYGSQSSYGADDPIAVAGIIMKVNMIVFAIVIGLAQGAQPIQSFNYGARNFRRVREAFRLAVIAGGGISIISFILFQIFPKEILMLFGKGSDSYFEFGVKFFRIFLFFTWINCLQPITSTFFTSIGKPIKGVFMSLTRQIIFFVPILLILPTIFGINGILYTGPIADVMSAVVAIILASYEFRAMNKLESKAKNSPDYGAESL